MQVDDNDNDDVKIKSWAAKCVNQCIVIIIIIIIIVIPIMQVDDDDNDDDGGDDALIDTFCCPGLYQVTWSLFNGVNRGQQNYIYLYKYVDSLAMHNH